MYKGGTGGKTEERDRRMSKDKEGGGQKFTELKLE